MTARKPKSLHKPNGRPTIMTTETLDKLKLVFSKGGTDEEACSYAEISPSLLYKYQKKNPDFVESKNALKEIPILQARETVVKALKTNPDIAFRYLERKRRDEFGVKDTGPAQIILNLAHIENVNVREALKGLDLALKPLITQSDHDDAEQD